MAGGLQYQNSSSQRVRKRQKDVKKKEKNYKYL